MNFSFFFTSFFLLFHQALKKAKKGIDVQLLGSLRDAERHEYDRFVEAFLPGVTGKKRWTPAKMRVVPMTEVVTVTDEAFGLLTLFNNETRWNSMADFEMRDLSLDEARINAVKNGTADDTPETTWKYYISAEGKVEVKYPETLYTSDSKKGQTKANSGWNQDGLIKFNDLVDMIISDRVACKGYDQYFIKKMIRNDRRNPKRKRIEEAPPPATIKMKTDLEFSDSEEEGGDGQTAKKHPVMEGSDESDDEESS